MTLNELQAVYERKLESSGLGNGDLKKLGFELYPDPKKLNILPSLPGFKIPYYGIDGKQTPHFRFRYLVDTRTQWEKLAKAKQQRYSQSKGSALEVYLPPIIEDWQELLDDATQPLIITEGELKAACACKNDFPTIGLGGVWAFMKDDKPLEFFEQVRWDDRRVYICYDSDAATNVHVNKAEARIAKLLGEWGARPHILRLPSDGPNKVGLDDYLLKFGVEKLARLITTAPPYAEVQMMHELNEELLVVLNPCMIMRRENDYLMGRQSFIGVAYADRVHWEETVTGKGDVKRKKVKTAEAWLEWPGRAVASSVVFAPGQPDFYEGAYNSWKGWPHVPNPKAGIQPWIDILDYAFQNSPVEHRTWFEQWAAYPIQHPGEKLATAVVMYGVVEGTGKTLIGVSLQRIYGPYGILISETQLHEDRNEWAVKKQFVLGDEVAGNDKRGVADLMRTMITRNEIQINQKYVPSYTLVDCINYYLTSNRPDAVSMSATDRRYYVHEMNGKPLPDEFYKEYDTWLKNGGVAALFAYLLDLDLTGFNPQAGAPITEAKQQMQKFGMSDVALWVKELIEDPNGTLGERKRDAYTCAELLMIYDPEGKKRVGVGVMGRVLKELSVWQPNRGNPIPVAGSSKRVYVVRNTERWVDARLQELSNHMEGGDDAKRKKYR